MTRKVLVTGGSGFIGRQILPLLVAAGDDVHAVNRHSLKNFPHDGVQFHTADLLDPSQTTALLNRLRPTHLLHMAWHVPPQEFWTSPENVRWAEASLHLIQEFASHGGKRCVAAGTCAEYSTDGDGLCTPGVTALRPTTLYATSKNKVGITLETLANQMNFSAAWGRIFHLYGPFEAPGRLVPSVIRALLDGKQAECTAGRQVRDVMHVRDVARAFVSVLHSDWKGPLNIASGIPVRVADIANTIGDLMGHPDQIKLGALPDRPHEPAKLVADVSSLRSLGFEPEHSLAQGLRDTIDWWRHVV